MVLGNEQKKDVLIKVVSRIIADSESLISDDPADPKATAIEIIETLSTLGFMKGLK